MDVLSALLHLDVARSENFQHSMAEKEIKRRTKALRPKGFLGRREKNKLSEKKIIVAGSRGKKGAFSGNPKD